MHRRSYLDNINYGNSHVGEIEDGDVNYGNSGNSRPIQNVPNKHCSDNPKSKTIVTLENLTTPPVVTTDNLYQYNGELYFNGKTVDKNIIFEQSIPETVWTIIHNLNKLPSVMVVDSSNRIVEGGYITYTNSNILTIEFGSSFSGKAYIN